MKKRNIRKTAAALTALALCAGVLTGCGGGASPGCCQFCRQQRSFRRRR